MCHFSSCNLTLLNLFLDKPTWTHILTYGLIIIETRLALYIFLIDYSRGKQDSSRKCSAWKDLNTDFVFENIFLSKIFGLKKNLGPKHFGSKNYLGQKKFGKQKKNVVYKN